jgi:molybdopterin converting factor small subunit
MQITIKTFASLKSFFPESVTEEIPEDYSLLDVIHRLKESRPAAASILDHCMVAVGEEMKDKNYILKSGEQVLIMPPASGG